LVQDAAAERSALRRKPSALVVGEPQATVAELLAQDAVLLFLEVLDDLALAAVHPAGEHQQQELKRRGRYPPILRPERPKIGRRHEGAASRKP